MILEGEVAFALIFLCNTFANSFMQAINLLLEFEVGFRISVNAIASATEANTSSVNISTTSSRSSSER